MGTAFSAFVASSLKAEHFTLIDIGCSGGIDPVWRIFGDRLRAIALDASVDECERLEREEVHPNIRYIAGFVGLPHNHPMARALKGKPPVSRLVFPRLSASRTLELQSKILQTASLDEKLQSNAWNLTKLADSEKSVVVPELLEQLGWNDADFLKIDIDGPDFQVLNSFDGQFEKLGLLAARLEVNFFGGVGEAEHTFHNTDRFMRARGFDLLALDVRTYSIRTLPSPFAITSPAQTVAGRPFQADAFYARDPAGDDWQEHAAKMSVEKIAKLAAIFSNWNQPDSAAELLVKFRKRLQELLDVDVGLELLAGEAQRGAEAAMSYADYIKAFEANAAEFYPPLSKPITFRGRLDAMVRAAKNPDLVQSPRARLNR